MIRDVLWSRRALRDLESQVLFVAQDNFETASRISAAIEATGNGLGRFLTGRPGRSGGYFEKSVANLPYILAYAIQERRTGEAVVILRVIHSAQNWPKGGWPQ